jgi:hypothetical protein
LFAPVLPRRFEDLGRVLQAVLLPELAALDQPGEDAGGFGAEFLAERLVLLGFAESRR